MSTEWIETRFPVAHPRTGEVVEYDGFTNGVGLGVFLEAAADPPGAGDDWLDDIWCICHLNTGHAVARVEGQRIAAFQIGEELAGIGDWTFTGIEGWKNLQPDLPQKVAETVRAYTKRGAFMTNRDSSQALATAVYTARLSASAPSEEST